MQALSIKELRNKLPLVRSELKKGEEFLIIYQSRPIAKLTPVTDLSDLSEVKDEEIERIALQEIDEDYLTPKELSYYLSLK